jgi:hypothetical protein
MQTRSKKSRTKPAKKVKQVDDFPSVARRLECDEDKEQFEKVLRKIAKAKPASVGSK